MKRFIIHKKDSSSSDTDYTSEYTSDTSDITDDSYTDTTNQSDKIVFNSITRTNYKKSSQGSRQDNLTKDEIKDKLKGYIPLRTMQEKKILTKLPYFKTWIKYINENTKQFRTGGLLMKVVYPDYIMLANTNQNLTWSVQLKDNIIFIKDPKEQQKEGEQQKKEDQIKDKLYEMYKKGELKTIKK